VVALVSRKLSRKFLKYVLIVSGILLLATRTLPDTLSVWQPFEVLFLLGNGITILFGIFAIIAFLIPVFQKRKQLISDEKRGTLILHDLVPGQAAELFSELSDVKFFCAASKRASCRGFYDCWLKNPSVCTLREGTENLGREIAKCDTFIILSKSLYGGFSKETKTALDRSIPFALPFFQVRNNEMHHQTRYNLDGKMQVYIYNSDSLSESEQNEIREVVKAVGVNMNKSVCETIFVDDVGEFVVQLQSYGSK
jgi:multimeric flavodoxin WrbA